MDGGPLSTANVHHQRFHGGGGRAENTPLPQPQPRQDPTVICSSDKLSGRGDGFGRSLEGELKAKGEQP